MLAGPSPSALCLSLSAFCAENPAIIHHIIDYSHHNDICSGRNFPSSDSNTHSTPSTSILCLPLTHTDPSLTMPTTAAADEDINQSDLAQVLLATRCSAELHNCHAEENKLPPPWKPNSTNSSQNFPPCSTPSTPRPPLKPRLRIHPPPLRQRPPLLPKKSRQESYLLPARENLSRAATAIRRLILQPFLNIVSPSVVSPRENYSFNASRNVNTTRRRLLNTYRDTPTMRSRRGYIKFPSSIRPSPSQCRLMSLLPWHVRVGSARCHLRRSPVAIFVARPLPMRDAASETDTAYRSNCGPTQNMTRKGKKAIQKVEDKTNPAYRIHLRRSVERRDTNGADPESRGTHGHAAPRWITCWDRNTSYAPKAKVCLAGGAPVTTRTAPISTRAEKEHHLPPRHRFSKLAAMRSQQQLRCAQRL
ncbi:hypothetical protein L249_3588 [Ophiocordyceps polyrhachis-furcata BCC 54312]|uniref:Uncharacterized protein n=1 Tax=Ophiocordyceps polyrhachis-furcata BCC 54312 TaxID=1330021 RepID=A0A367LMN4_9HYPO|nr:hypothetical protein L249_3588 [Ophiocordyceps polyrhachis-furcata BCC 54312]